MTKISSTGKQYIITIPMPDLGFQGHFASPSVGMPASHDAGVFRGTLAGVFDPGSRIRLNRYPGC